MRIFFIGISCIIVILSSCNKEIINPQKDSITVGDYSNMTRNSYDTILKLNHSTDNKYGLDINNDNVYDYQLIIDNGDSHPIFKILCLNSNSKLLGELEIDSTFYRIDGDNTYYSCSRMTENDIIIEVIPDAFKIKPKKENDIIKSTDYYETDTAFIINANYAWAGGHGTIWFYTYQECDNLSLNVDLFIGTKIIVDEKEKLGWIKILIMNNGLLILTETAIQE